MKSHQSILILSINSGNLFNNIDCAKNYDLMRFKVINNCTNSFDLVILKAISIFFNKPELCKQKELDFKVSFFLVVFGYFIYLKVSLFVLTILFCNLKYVFFHEIIFYNNQEKIINWILLIVFFAAN